MKFSIIVVCLNAGEELHKTVQSILDQSYGDFEIIIKDGLSKDGSIQSLKRDSRIKVSACKDSGIYDAMNQAYVQASGEYIYFLNCGDYFYERDTLLKVSRYMKEHPGRNIYYGDIYERLRESHVASNPHLNAFACYRNVPCHQACFYQRELLRNHPFQTGYKVRADYEQFLWCFFKAHASTFYMKDTICSYQGGGYSETEEGLRRSEIEHREIAAIYFQNRQILWYRFLLTISMAKLRTKIAGNPATAGFYNRIKDLLYKIRAGRS